MCKSLRAAAKLLFSILLWIFLLTLEQAFAKWQYHLFWGSTHNSLKPASNDLYLFSYFLKASPLVIPLCL